MKSTTLSDKVEVEFADKGVQIKHYNFAVTCDFTAVNVSHTFVNGVLSITQQGSPNQAKCTCYTDVSYTISGISKDEVNVIFINGVQVYCYNEDNTLQGTKWKLVKVRELSMVSGIINLDYSLYNVIFEFKANGVLTVSDASEHFDRFPEIGECSYSIINNSQIYIKNLLWWYSISSEELVIDASPLDGDTYYFIN